jgi:hypothetical protein
MGCSFKSGIAGAFSIAFGIGCVLLQIESQISKMKRDETPGAVFGPDF